jgi:hypothetical protein
MPAGRPEADIDLDQLEKLAGLGCTVDEMAAFFDVHRRTLERRCQKDKEYTRALEVGRQKAKLTLRRKQWNLAMKEHPTMLIWLGKQLLGQKQHVDLGGEVQVAHAATEDAVAEVRSFLAQLHERAGQGETALDTEPDGTD